jgi:inosine triphosphate pyrophosphatase
MWQPIIFVTGNAHKLREAEENLGVKLVRRALDLPELQLFTSDEVAIGKSATAAQIVGGPVVLDDTALHFHAIAGLPGAYVRTFVDKLTPANLARLPHVNEEIKKPNWMQ